MTVNNVLFLWYVVLTPFSCQKPIEWFENICFAGSKTVASRSFACIHILFFMYQCRHIVKLKLLYREKCEQFQRCDISCSLRGILVVFSGKWCWFENERNKLGDHSKFKHLNLMILESTKVASFILITRQRHSEIQSLYISQAFKSGARPNRFWSPTKVWKVKDSELS